MKIQLIEGPVSHYGTQTAVSVVSVKQLASTFKADIYNPDEGRIGTVAGYQRSPKANRIKALVERLKEDLERQETTDELMVGAAKGGLIPPKSGKTPHGDKGLASLADYDMTNTEFINGRY